jgi:glycosyltransferase involved in cell wall biosynthesis
MSGLPLERPYRILHIIDHLGPGGAQEALLNLVKYADRGRFHLEVAAMHGLGVYWEPLRQERVPVHSLSPHKFVPLYLSNLIRLLHRGRFDLVHCHLIAANLIAKPVAALCKVPVLFNHDQCNDVFRYRNKGRLWLDHLANRFTDHIIAVSKSTQDFLQDVEKIPPHKVSLIYNAVDLERFAPGSPELRRVCRQKFGFPEKALVVLGAGRLQAQKNFTGFLEVAASLSRTLPEVRFAIAGEGPDRTSLEHLADRLGLADRVKFLGFVTPMRDLYLASDVLFFPSLFEGTPMTVLEAMAAGLPIVASEIDGTAEVLTDGVDGFLVPVEQSQVLAQRLAIVLQDQSLAQGLAQRARAKVREHFAAPAMAQQVERLYLQHLITLSR